jgi:hypothetical protein
MSITAPEAAARRTDQNYAAGTSFDGAVAGVLAAVWCRSVGASWTLEVHELGRGRALGTIMDWISSGVPISQPEPEELARELLTERGLYLFDDSSAGPCTHNRRGIGYVSRNAELIKLAYRVREDAAETTAHPLVLATQWIMAGFSADVELLDQVGLTAPEWLSHPGTVATRPPAVTLHRVITSL